MNDLTTQEQKRDIAPSVSRFLEVISIAARDQNVDVAKLHGLIDVQERLLNKQAEINFNNALADMQAVMPTIKKDGRIVHKDKVTGKDVVISTYAKYETIDKVIRPLLQQFGFSLRYNTKTIDGKIIVTGTLAHRDGHSITDEIPLTIESGGAKNNVQGVGSTISYGQRYLVKMLLNLVFEDEDDDGQKAGFVAISDDQASEIKGLIERLSKSGVSIDVKKFLEYVGSESVDMIALKDYDRAIQALRKKEVK